MTSSSATPSSGRVGSLRAGLFAEIVGMALDTLRANKLRSALTILGVVIGVTSIVAMTSLIRGFGDQMHALIRQMGSDTVYVQKFGFSSWASGRSFIEVLRRPNLSEEDAKAIVRGGPSVAMVGLQLGGGPGSGPERITSGGHSTKQMAVIGASANFAETNYITLENGRFFSEFEVSHRRPVVVLGHAPASTLFVNADPIGKHVRIGAREYTVVGTMGKRPSPLGNPDEFVVIPVTTYEKFYSTPRIRGILTRFLTISVVPRAGVSREQVVREVEEVMRSRHRLKLDEENDFDVVTSDAVMKIVDQLTSAIALALLVISSIALMVGGIGVMAIMTISVTERTREIGIRKAIGARRREVLVQFLLEAVFLTSIGGLLGILLGSGIGLGVNQLAGFPVSLPLWSFALGFAFSASVGIFFGMYPALRASRLDPIEALRYE
ncbi:MAG: ABC transporter permease [Burkholderiales bacterium]